jgi:hypothetical protein
LDDNGAEMWSNFSLTADGIPSGNVPEPASAWLLLSGLGALGTIARESRF